jgi:23S rRNA (cytidine1920-2'-O)/16S rRNA (cytidine1409-2'-O)-methyltransferase
LAKKRADLLLVERGLADTRAKAQAMIMAGEVFSAETRIDKPGVLLAEERELRIQTKTNPYVSRGGLKLAGALRAFPIECTGLVCLDVGASTGGFTDCLLQHGAARVFAVDVGHGQLAEKLRVDSRVTSRERTNARTLTVADLGEAVDFTVVDASFIGLGRLLPAIAQCTRLGGHLLALIKPQFEVGKEEASKARGVIRDPAQRLAAIEGALDEVRANGFVVRGTCDSPIAGPKGNLEAFVFAERR